MMTKTNTSMATSIYFQIHRKSPSLWKTILPHMKQLRKYFLTIGFLTQENTFLKQENFLNFLKITCYGYNFLNFFLMFLIFVISRKIRKQSNAESDDNIRKY